MVITVKLCSPFKAKETTSCLFACASENNKDYETCFIASNTEKQIWLEYDKMLKCLAKSQLSHPFHQIFSVSMLDPIVATSAVNNSNYKGMPYYYTGPHEKSLIQIIKEHGLIRTVYKNIALFAKNQNNVPDQEQPLSLKKLVQQMK